MKDCAVLMSYVTATLVWCSSVEIHPALVTKLGDDAPSGGARLAMFDLDCQRPPRSNAERRAIHLLNALGPSSEAAGSLLRGPGRVGAPKFCGMGPNARLPVALLRG